MVAGISGGGPPGDHEIGGRALGGWARPVPSWPNGGPPGVFSVPEILKYSIKSHTKFPQHLENFYFRAIVNGKLFLLPD